MNENENTRLARRLFEEAFNRKNLDVIDALVAANVIDHNPAPGAAPAREGMRDALRALRIAFPNLRATLDDIVAEGDYVCLRWTMRGTHNGRYMGLKPTGRRIEVGGADILRFHEGKLIARWGSCDAMGAVAQLGLVQLSGGAHIRGIPKLARTRTSAATAREFRRRRIRERIRKYVTQFQLHPTWATPGAA